MKMYEKENIIQGILPGQVELGGYVGKLMDAFFEERVFSAPKECGVRRDRRDFPVVPKGIRLSVFGRVNSVEGGLSVLRELAAFK